MTLFYRFFQLFMPIETMVSLGASKKLSDEELVKEIIESKNTLLFSTLYDRYSKKIYNKCLSFVKNSDEAQDLTQDVFLKIYTKLNTYKGNAKFSTWVYSFTYNFCVNYVNRDKGKKMEHQSDSFENHEYRLNEIEDVSEEELFEIKAANLSLALNEIDPKDKAILLLKYQDEASIQDIQKVMKIGESAVKMRLKRARIKVVEAHEKLK